MSKTLSFACVHFGVAFALTWWITGSVTAGGAVALVEPLCNTVAFHWHEKAWACFAAHRRATGTPGAAAAAPGTA